MPPIKAGKADSARIEFRAPDPAATRTSPSRWCSPPACKGIEEGYDLPARDARPTSTSSPRRSGWPRASRSCPASLAEALDEMERSELVAEALGEHVFEWFIRNKRAEWQEYKTQVTQFELDRYLPRL